MSFNGNSSTHRKFLPSPTYEQSVIINDVARGYNVSVNSVAGSGKTTVFFHIAVDSHIRKRKCIIVVYNDRLRQIEEKRSVDLGICADIVSAYSLATRLYGINIHNNDMLGNVMRRKTINTEYCKTFDIGKEI